MNSLVHRNILIFCLLGLFFTSQANTFEMDCEKPTNSQFSAEDISYDHAYLECSINNAPKYDYQWRRKGTSSWSNLVGNSNHRRKIENLNHNTEYEYRCRYDCDNEWTPWSNRKDFRTDNNNNNNCDKPSTNQFSAEDISHDHAYLECSINNAPKYDYQWRKKGTSNWSDLEGNSNHRRKIENLDHNTEYQYRCRYDCDNEWTPWSNHREFRTDNNNNNNCNKPTSSEFEANDIDYDHCYMNCYITGADKYDYQWRRQGTNSWSSLEGNQNHRRKVENLQEDKWYEYEARYWCNGQWSDWSDHRTFKTLTQGGECNVPDGNDYDAVDISYDHAYFECYLGGYPKYDYRWRKRGTSNWSDLDGNNNHRRKIENLEHDTWYEYQCRYECENIWTSWAGPKEFKTQMNTGNNCNRPVDDQYKAVDIEGMQAYLECYITGSPRYDFRWRKKNTNSWSDLDGTSDFRRKIDNLSPATWYDYQCRYECNGEFTSWSISRDFKTLDENNSCEKPSDSDYNAVDIDRNQVYFECYIGGSPRYDYRWRKQNTNNWSDLDATGEQRRKIENLSSNNWYEYQCRYECQGSLTDWSSTKTFKTLEDALSCDALSSNDYDATDITANYAYLECSIAGSPSYDYRWRQQGTSDWSDLAASGEQRRKIEDLNSETTYEYQARYECDDQFTPWSSGKTFTTESSSSLSCDAPPTGELATSNATENSARLNCTMQGFDGYQYRYRSAGEEDWTTLETSSEPAVEVDELNSGSTYQFQCRLTCGDDTQSDWSESAQFATLGSSTAVVTISDAEWQISPNPASNFLQIDARAGLVQIYNMIGKSVGQYEITQGQMSVPLDLSPGLYVVTLTDGKDFGSKKLMVR